MAGVSVGTVSHVLNHPGRVRETTRRRVEEAIEQLGFVPNSNASRLAGSRNRTIGFVATDISNSFFVDMAQGAQRRAADDGMMLQLGHSAVDQALEERHLDVFNSARVAGILLATMWNPSAAMKRVRRLGTPVVVLNYDWKNADHCSVLVDNEKAGYLAAQHMIELGRRHLVFIGGIYNEAQPAQYRRHGVRHAVAEATGIELTELTVEDLNAPGGQEAGRQILAMPEKNRPDAVIGVTDLLGMTVIQQLLAAGLTVPEDIAVMGCDYNASAWGGSVPLTSVNMRGETMGEAAVDLLLEELHDPEHQHRRTVTRPSLVVRQSTAG